MASHDASNVCKAGRILNRGSTKFKNLHAVCSGLRLGNTFRHGFGTWGRRIPTLPCRSLMEQRYLFVINPASGAEDKQPLLDALEQAGPADYYSIYWSEPGDEALLKTWIDSGAYAVAVAAGGDGTVAAVAHACIGTHVSLAILPMGSGNGLAKDLRIGGDWLYALEHLREWPAQPTDAIAINGSRCFHLADAGLNAQVIQQYQAENLRTTKAYAWQLIKAYLAAEPWQGTLYTDGIEALSGSLYLVALCNGRSYGSDVIINPHGRPDDGRMEVVVLREFPKTAGLGLLFDLLAGDTSSPYFATFSCHTARLEAKGPVALQIDGEAIEATNRLEAWVLPGALQVIRP